MTELSYRKRLSIVGQGERAGEWQQLLESELARTHNLAAEPAQADGLVVVIGSSFAEALNRPPGKRNKCAEVIRGAWRRGRCSCP